MTEYRLIVPGTSQFRDVTSQQFEKFSKDTIVFVCPVKHLSCFAEYICSLGIFSFVALYNRTSFEESVQKFSQMPATFVFTPLLIGPHSSRYQYASCAKNFILLNSEQATSDRLKPILRYVFDGGKLIDYSPINRKLWQKACLSQSAASNETLTKFSSTSCFLPYGFANTEESVRLKQLVAETEKLFDFVFVGSMTPRRTELIDKLRLVGGFTVVCLHPNSTLSNSGDKRDQIIAQARVLLNIHAQDDFDVYESIRCERWRRAGMPILSETCLDMPAGKHCRNILFVDFVSLDSCQNMSQYLQRLLNTTVGPGDYSEGELYSSDVDWPDSDHAIDRVNHLVGRTIKPIPLIVEKVD